MRLALGTALMAFSLAALAAPKAELWERWQASTRGKVAISHAEWNDFLGDEHNFRQFNLTYPTRDGVIDTLAWEGIREAVDDVRYATLLKTLAAKVIATGKTENVYLGRQALLWLERVDETSADLNTARLEMINYILKLKEVQ